MHPSATFVACEFLNSPTVRSPDEVIVSLWIKSIHSLTETPYPLLEVRSVVTQLRWDAPLLSNRKYAYGEFLPEICFINIGAGSCLGCCSEFSILQLPKGCCQSVKTVEQTHYPSDDLASFHPLVAGCIQLAPEPGPDMSHHTTGRCSTQTSVDKASAILSQALQCPDSESYNEQVV